MAKVMARGWIGIAEAAALTGLSAPTLRRYERRGWIESVRTPGGHRRYKRTDLIAFMEGLPARLRDRATWVQRRKAVLAAEMTDKSVGSLLSSPPKAPWICGKSPLREPRRSSPL